MSAAPRPQLKDARRKFWWGEHDLIDYGVIAHVGTSAWAVYTCLLRHINDEGSTLPSVPLLMAETGLSNRVIAQSIARLKTVHLISVDRASHQWNVYIILDVVHAIKKNGWVRVEKKARDEKSPARQGRPAGKKQVTKSHLARDEKSPEQVTKSHPNKNHSKRTKEEGGVLDVGEDAHEDAQPATAPVAEPSPDPRTTFSASPSTAEAMPFTPTLGTPVTSPAALSGVAVLEPPVGGAADAAEQEDAISLEEFEGLLERGNDRATHKEDVPAGAAAVVVSSAEAPRGALLAPGSLGVAHLVPVPRDELLNRPVASLDSEQMRTIRTLVTGKLIRDGLLDQLTPTGGLSREDWLRLTLEELDLVKRAAQADAAAGIGGFISQVIDGLDRMIGGGRKAKAQPATVHGGGALALAKRPEADTTPEEGRYREGARWRCKKTGHEVSIVGTEEVRSRNGVGARYVLSDGQRLPALNLVLGYEFVGQTGKHAAGGLVSG